MPAQHSTSPNFLSGFSLGLFGGTATALAAGATAVGSGLGSLGAMGGGGGGGGAGYASVPPAARCVPIISLLYILYYRL